MSDSQKFFNSNRHSGFTLIELIVVIAVLAILAAVAISKFASIDDEARLVTLKAFKGAIAPMIDITHSEIILRPEGKAANSNFYTFEDGTQIRIRGDYPDGRWNNTFALIIDIFGYDITQVNNNNCEESDPEWCVRQRGTNWFVNRGYTTSSNGRGFIIFPRGNNVNNDECYVYYFNPNQAGNITDAAKPRVDYVDDEC